MRWSDAEITRVCRQRISRFFGIPVEHVHAAQVFGTDLRDRSEKSDFRYGALDHILHDIHDVADKETLAAINAGAFEVRTVDDYCNHMIRCYQTNENAVATTLERDRRSVTANTAPDGAAPSSGRGKWFRRIVGTLGAVSVVAALVWRFVAPVTGIYADLVFIAVMILGFGVAKAFRVI